MLFPPLFSLRFFCLVGYCFCFLNSCTTPHLEDSSWRQPPYIPSLKEEENSLPSSSYSSQHEAVESESLNAQSFSTDKQVPPHSGFLRFKEHHHLVEKDYLQQHQAAFQAASYPSKRCMLEHLSSEIKKYATHQSPLSSARDHEAKAQHDAKQLLNLSPKAQGALNHDESILEKNSSKMKPSKVKKFLEKKI